MELFRLIRSLTWEESGESGIMGRSVTNHSPSGNQKPGCAIITPIPDRILADTSWGLTFDRVPDTTDIWVAEMKMCDASGSCSARMVSTTASTSRIALVRFSKAS
jgi:hypothetical protein